MSQGSWETMGKAKEDEYFERKNREALDRLASKEQEPRLSPITGKPMEQVVIHGVVIDRCPTSGGIWLDAGELELLMEAQKKEGQAESCDNWISSFFNSLSGGK